jgi:hypothetical protein
MGVRELINRHSRPVLACVALAAIASGAFFFVFHQPDGLGPLDAGSAFYSVDDGKTYFRADATNIPPFMHDGKEAVQALVYTVDGGKTRYVGYLMRFTPFGIQRLKDVRAKAAATSTPTLPGLDTELQANTEVKRPGAQVWVKLSDLDRAAEIMRVRSPTDPTKFADPVDP